MTDNWKPDLVGRVSVSEVLYQVSGFRSLSWFVVVWLVGEWVRCGGGGLCPDHVAFVCGSVAVLLFPPRFAPTLRFLCLPDLRCCSSLFFLARRFTGVRAAVTQVVYFLNGKEKDRALVRG